MRSYALILLQNIFLLFARLLVVCSISSFGYSFARLFVYQLISLQICVLYVFFFVSLFVCVFAWSERRLKRLPGRDREKWRVDVVMVLCPSWVDEDGECLRLPLYLSTFSFVICSNFL